MLKSFTATATLLVVVVPIAGTPAHAQQSSAHIAVTGGVATDQLGVRSSAVSIAPTITVSPNGNLSLQLGASATRFATELWSLGAGASFTGRNRLGRFAAMTLNGSAGASQLRGNASATFAQGEMTPALELRVRGLTLFGGVRGVTGRTSQQIDQAGIPIPGRPQATTIDDTRSGFGPVYGAVFDIRRDEGTLRLGAREDRLRISDETISDRSLSVSATEGQFTLGLSGGVRAAPGENVAFGSAAISLGLASGASLDLAAGRYPSNRALGTPGGNYVSAGLSFRFGGLRERSLPAPEGVRPVPRGATRLSIRAADAQRVEIAGDFNEWVPAAANRAANGVWYADLKIPPGQYRYAFRVNGVEWRVPDGATAVDDGFGGKSAWVTVPVREH